MDVYPSVTDYISSLPVFCEWQEARALLNKFASHRPRDWKLPFLACEAVGGTTEQAIPAAAALGCAQIGIILVDDMLDADPRGEYHQVGEGQAANFAASFLSAAPEAILQSEADPKVKLAGIQCVNKMMLTIALGQYLDSQALQDEEAYWRVVDNKSAPFFGCAIHLGALFGGASGKVALGLERFGQIYGELIQIHDDLNDTMSEPANPDWTEGRSPLPILFAQLVDYPEHARFCELRRNIMEPDALREAQGILIRCGAVSYCVNELMRRYSIARSLLDAVPLVHREPIDSLLDGIITPVLALFETMGNEPLDRISFLAQSEAQW